MKTILWFLFSSGSAATIGLVLANIIQPGKGLILGTIENTVEVKELPGVCLLYTSYRVFCLHGSGE